MITGGENVPILVLDTVSFEAWRIAPGETVVLSADNNGNEYLFVRGYPVVFRKQRTH